MLSKEVKRRIKTKRVLRALRHAIKLVRKQPSDLKGVTRAMMRIHNGAPINHRKMLESFPTLKKVEIISKVDATEEEFHSRIQSIFASPGFVKWPDHGDEFPLQHERGTNTWLVFLRVPQPKKEPFPYVEH